MRSDLAMACACANSTCYLIIPDALCDSAVPFRPTLKGRGWPKIELSSGNGSWDKLTSQRACVHPRRNGPMHARSRKKGMGFRAVPCPRCGEN